MSILRKAFSRLAENYTSDNRQIQVLWQEIERAYSGKSRFYHNETHLQNLLSELAPILTLLENADAVLFAVFYHDIIYSTVKKDNELKSAEVAEKRLLQLGVPADVRTKCYEHIIATATHVTAANDDTNYFTDADLSILGKPLADYQHYYQSIRKEYKIFPDILYNSGRKKVLRHFLDQPQIFKTPYFAEKYETQARANLQTELINL